MKIDTLKNLANFIGSGCTPSRKNISYWNSKDVLWLKTEQLGEYKITSTSEYISHNAVTECNLRIYPKNTISVAMYGEGKTRGNVSLLGAPMTTNQACCNIEIDDTKIDYRYVYYYLKGQYENLRQMSAGVRKNLNADDIKNFIIRYPEDKVTQKKIAALLGALDDKIALNKKINATLEAMAKTLYDYWFVQFDFPDENGKPYKTSGGKMIYSSELGRDIPAGWEVDTLEGKIAITRGISYSTETLSTNAEGIAMINLASVDRKRNYIPNGLKFFIGDVPNEKKLQARDMLIACTDLTRQAEIIGSPILVMNDREYTFSMDLAKLTVTSEKLNELYLYMTLRTNFYHQYIVGFASGTTVLHLNTSGIAWYKVLIPPITLQEKFAEVMKNIYLQTCKNICENQRLAELRDWLLPMLINRQIDFKKGEN